MKITEIIRDVDITYKGRLSLKLFMSSRPTLKL